MYECWIFTISESKRKIIVWGNHEKVYEFRKGLGFEDFGGGFDCGTLAEVQAQVNSLKINHPTAKEIRL